MSVHRFLSKRDKHRDGHKHLHILHHHQNHNSVSQHSGTTDDVTPPLVDANSAEDFHGLFHDTGNASSSEEQKIKVVRQKIITAKSIRLRDSHILWALRSKFSNGNSDAAYDLLHAMSDASEGIIIPYNPRTKLLGAVNRKAVTCFLDSTLFAMFSRLDSFEAMLYNSFDDLPRNRLAFLLRLWVNLLRAGKLISVDITMHVQQELVECGWLDAGELHQQDASEAFTFITEKLKLPLLTLKMDMFHAGKQDADDHRFINERLLEVAIPASEDGKRKDIKLEDCLEDYFNNRIEVRRFLERRSTLSSMRSFDSTSKSGAIHVESVELDGSDSPQTPLSPLPSYMSSSRPSIRTRAPSIIQERFIPEGGDSEIVVTPTTTNESTIKRPTGRMRKGSVRKEVLMPAWQFFSLIPWYTDNAPSTDAQVAQHFSSRRPILGLCLKRYSMLPNGKAIRLNTFIDIPVEIGLPHFIQDDHINGGETHLGNFKLSLQSMVCHRGNSVDSGHYVSLVRGTTRSGGKEDTSAWMRFDDLSGERITMVDIYKALSEETPYLLFYQIMPIDGDPGNLTAGESPPRYEDSRPDGEIDGSSVTDNQSSIVGSRPASRRASPDLPSPGEIRGRSFNENRRSSAVSFNEQMPSIKQALNESGEAVSRKSTSLSRTYSRGANALTKTLSNLAMSKAKEPPHNSIAGETEVLVEITEAESHTPRQSSTVLKVADDTSKSQRREKSRSRLGRGLGKHRHEDPDRECSVM